MIGELLLSVQDAKVAFGPKALFENLTFNIHRGQKISLVGRNGTGKTTLMRIITGEKELDDGERLQMLGVTIGYMQQEVAVKPGQTVFEYVFEQLPAAERHMMEYKVELVIQPLNLDPNDRMDKLSGGQIRRAALARALVEDPDILLLDEPTNHLDLEVIEWLEVYLKSYQGALVVISHDRAFLANVSDRIFWLDRGKLRVAPKGFRHFDDWSTEILDQEGRELKNRQNIVAQEMEWANRGVKARRKRNQRRLEMARDAASKLENDQKSYKRALAKITLTPPKMEEGTSKIVAEYYRVGKSYTDEKTGKEKRILDGFSFRIQRGDRIGILGRNGSGKTTLLKLLVGQEKPDKGSVKLAAELEISYFDQQRESLNPDDSLWKTLCPTGGDHIEVMEKRRHVIGYLKDFMFDPDQALQQVKTLSGGQKNRLMLAKILANPGSLLILDEPTNDLDMDTLDMIEDVLSNYKGTLLVVSHDRDFLDQTVTQVLAFEGDAEVLHCIGGYSDYIEAKEERDTEVERKEAKQQAKVVTKAVEIEAAPEPQKAKKLSYKLEYEHTRLPEKIAKLEAEVSEITAQLGDADLYSRDPALFTNLSRRLGQARDELDTAETRWLELEDMKASLAS
jgi:ATP-binding cassette subfamily F protein uup